jgi:serine beta-lactamase-like protein LACTB
MQRSGRTEDSGCGGSYSLPVNTRALVGTALAALMVAVLAAAGVAYWALSRPPLHPSAAAVPSTAAAAPTTRFEGAVAASRLLARDLVVAGNLPGLSVAVAVHGDIAWAEGFGWTDGEDHRPITPRTRFRLGALSKPLTAFGAALLHDRGRLDLDAPVQRYLPGYPQQRWAVTLRQLMGDVAGVHRIRGDNNDAMPVTHCDDLDQAVALLAGEPLLFEPGTQHRYSIWGWVLVSAAVERAAGESFTRFMTRDVFAPLGMDRTLVEEAEALEDFAHASGDRPDYSCLAGGGAFVSTPTDLVRFGSAMLRPGLLPTDTIAAMQTPGRLTSGASTTYALGWTVTSVTIAGRSMRLVSHRGSPAGGTATLLTFPDSGLAIAVAANAADAGGVTPFALQVAEAFASAAP